MKLVVIEGLDGAGKSTQIELLRNYFRRMGANSEFIHFPRTEAPYFGELITRFLKGEFGTASEVDPYLVAMLYAGDRNDAAPRIRKWLQDKHLVILDRYTYSNVAYQCAKKESPQERDSLREWILDLEFNHFAIPVPDLNIFLDVPFSFTKRKLASERSGTDRHYLGGTIDIHEADISFQQKVRDVYIDTAKVYSGLSILKCEGRDGTMLPPDAIFKMIVDLMKEKGIIV